MMLLINACESGGHMLRFLFKSHRPDTTYRQTRRLVNEQKYINRPTEESRHVKPQRTCCVQVRFYNAEHHNTSISNIKRISTTTLFAVLSLTLFSLPLFCKPFCSHSLSVTFCFPVTSVPFYLGWKETDKCFSIYSEVEVLLLGWNFLSQTKISDVKIPK